MRRSSFLATCTALAAFMYLAAPALASGGLDIEDPSDGDTPPTPTDSEHIPVSGEVAPAPAAQRQVRVLVADGDAQRYRGTLTPCNDRSGYINTVALDDYLQGVVPMEMPSSWPLAALQAQAVVARTFALRRSNPQRAYDVIAGSADQEYGGIRAEAAQANQAVISSLGFVVLYEGQLANVAYMGCCGGHTDDAGRVWGTSYPYLQGVPDPYCADAPDRNWSVALSWQEFARAARLDPNAQPQSIVPADVGPGGRPASLHIQGVNLAGDVALGDLRQALGGRLPSTFIHAVALQGGGTATPDVRASLDADMNSDTNDNVAPPGTGDALSVVITGSGHGHGVGLCQWGAHGMAMAGATAQQIISYYFPGTTLGTVATPFT